MADSRPDRGGCRAFWSEAYSARQNVDARMIRIAISVEVSESIEEFDRAFKRVVRPPQAKRETRK